MSDWLKKRLTPAKREQPRWLQLADTLERFWEENFDPAAKRMSDARSAFTAHSDDLKIKMGELGDYFRDDIGTPEDRPIQVCWRRLELQGKETTHLLNMAIRRKFFGIGISWVPLLAHKVDAYGTNLKTTTEIGLQGLDPNDFFLTSRGRISFAAETLRIPGVDFLSMVQAVEQEIRRFLPTHIVYEGIQIEYDPVESELYFGGFVVEGTHEYVTMGV